MSDEIKCDCRNEGKSYNPADHFTSCPIYQVGENINLRIWLSLSHEEKIKALQIYEKLSKSSR
jgi:hypothetical protein